jgi:hypothetical protein
MYQRIEHNSKEKPDKFELPPFDVDQAVSLLQSWNAEEPQEQQEQRETWEYLKKTLDEDRISDRKLFP